MLQSLPYYDELRQNAVDVKRAPGSNLDHFTTPDGQDIAICHISGVFPFTYGDFVPQEGNFEDAASILLAIEHLNTGDGSIVPQISGLNERCNVRFTTEFADTEFSGGVALGHVVEQTSRQLPERLPCAFLGAYRSAVSIPMSIVTGLLGYPQVSSASTSADLDDKSQYPLFGRTLPSDAGTTVPIILYMQNVLQVNHLAVINVNDAYGNAYVEGLRRAAELHAPDMHIHQIPLDEGQGSIESTIANLKNTGYRFIFCLVFTRETHDALLMEAYEQGVAGTGKHNWLFADSFLGTLDGRTFDPSSPLALSYRGSALMEVSGGVPGIPNYDKFTAQMANLRNHPDDFAYLGSLVPKHDHPAYGSKPPFMDDPQFLNGAVINGYTPFMYEATIALGLSACNAYHNLRPDFTGAEHYDLMVHTNFTGISGEVVLDPTTGTRDPASALYRVANYVQEETADGSIKYVPVVTDLFQNGAWNQKEKYIFNDGTTNLPSDLPPPASEDINLALVIFVPVVAVFVLSVIVYLFRENKRKNNDSIWKVQKEELLFGDPPEIVGRGTFGVVLLAEYRGTQVAVKRVIPPSSSKSKSGSKGSKDSKDTDDTDLWAASMGESNVTSAGMSGTYGMASGYTSWGGLSLSNTKNMSTFTSSRFWQKNEKAVLKKMKQDFVEEMRYLSKLRHPCVTTIMGAVMGKEPMLVMEYMEHGSLYDLLHNETMVIEGELLLPILRDISQGVRFLHSANPQVIHGDLKAQNILVDNKFRAKVADFGLSQKQNLGGTGTPFWMAPELLRKECTNTAASDVYSFGIILYEVYSRRDPYEDENPKEVLRLVADKKVQKRPPAPRNMCDKVKSLMADCLEDDHSLRPTFEELDTRLKRIDAESADPSQAPKSKSSSISLFDIFPRHIAEALRDGRTIEPEHRDSVTIFFSDIVGFTTISSQLDPRKVAQMLDRLYQKFDQLSHMHDVFKVETIGDAYVAVSNLVKEQNDDHAKRIAEFAIDAMAAANETLIDVDNPAMGCVNIRVGFHSGSVVADVVGTRNPRYCLFGDTVNVASRMESNSQVNRIQCSKPAAKLLHRQCPSMPITSRGKIEIKGKGKMHTYWVNERGDSAPTFAESRPTATALLRGEDEDSMGGNKDESSDFFPSGDLSVPSAKSKRKSSKMATLEEVESSEFEIEQMADIEAPPEAAPEAAPDASESSLDTLRNQLIKRLSSYKRGILSGSFKVDEVFA